MLDNYVRTSELFQFYQLLDLRPHHEHIALFFMVLGLWFLRELRKNIRKRLHLWFIFAIIFLLLDEYLKEGYLFKIEDVAKLFTHEFLITITIFSYLIYLILLLVSRVKLYK